MSATATRAAVFTGVGQPLEIQELELDDPKPGEVKVKIAASGVCHSDLSIQNGTLPLAPPIVLGHEGAGVVVDVGEGVTAFKPGDHVVTTWVGQCGTCYVHPRRAVPVRGDVAGAGHERPPRRHPASPSTASPSARCRRAARSPSTRSCPRSRA